MRSTGSPATRPSPDFFYRDADAAIYIDGPPHDAPHQIREDDATTKDAGGDGLHRAPVPPRRRLAPHLPPPPGPLRCPRRIANHEHRSHSRPRLPARRPRHGARPRMGGPLRIGGGPPDAPPGRRAERGGDRRPRLDRAGRVRDVPAPRARRPRRLHLGPPPSRRRTPLHPRRRRPVPELRPHRRRAPALPARAAHDGAQARPGAHAHRRRRRHRQDHRGVPHRPRAARPRRDPPPDGALPAAPRRTVAARAGREVPHRGGAGALEHHPAPGAGPPPRGVRLRPAPVHRRLHRLHQGAAARRRLRPQVPGVRDRGRGTRMHARGRRGGRVAGAASSATRSSGG